MKGTGEDSIDGNEGKKRREKKVMKKNEAGSIKGAMVSEQ